MLKKVLLLVFSVNMLAAIPNSPAGEELTSRQKALVHFDALISAIGVGTIFGSIAVSRLPEKSSFALKAVTFVPVTICCAVLFNSDSQEKIMLDFYKKHRWLLLGL